MGGVIQRAREVFDDADLVQSASGIWCPSVQGPGGLILRDLSKNSNDGTLTNMDTGDWVDRALDFNTNDYVDLGGNDFDGSLTIAGWFRTNTVASGAKAIVSNCSGNGGRQDVVLEINRTAGRIATIWGSVVIGTGSTSLAANRWYHAAVVRGGSSGNWDWRLYLDGALDASGSTATDPNGSTEGTAIGRAGAYNGQYFDGLIDDVRIYPHALKPQQIARLYSNGQGRGIGLRPSRYVYEPIRTLTYPTLSTGLAAAWDAPEQGPGGSVFRDLSTNKNNAALTITPSQWTHQSLFFDGVGQWGDIPNNDSLNVDKTGTLSAWVMLYDLVNIQRIYTKITSGSSGWGITSVGDEFKAFYKGGGPSDRIVASGTIVANRWYHVAATFNGDGDFIFYLNGVETDREAQAGTNIGTNTNIARIGRRNDWGGDYFYGEIGSVYLHNRDLTPGEIRTLASRPSVLFETTEVSPYTTQWGSVAAAEAAAFQAAWGANATTIAGVASGL